MAGLHIDIDDIDEDISELPVGPAEQAISQQMKDGTPKSLRCFDLLDEKTQGIIASEAVDQYDLMSDDTKYLMEYGDDAVDSMNRLIDLLATEIEPVEIPEITKLTEELTQEMGTLHRKYNVKNPKVLRVIERAVEGKGRRLFSKADDVVQGMLFDARETKGKIDIVHADLSDEKRHMLENAAKYDMLYKTNQREIIKLIRVIAVLEKVRALAEQDMRAVAHDPDELSAGQDDAKVGEIADFIRLLDLQITAFKDRLIYGWTTGPDIRRSRHAIVALAQSINGLMKLTVPTMQGTVLKWILLVQAKQAAKLKGVVADAANLWVEAGAEASAEAVPEIIKAAHEPIIQAETIDRIVELTGIQTDKLLEVYNEINSEQRNANDAMRRARLALQRSNIELAETTVDEELVERAKRLS
jgi:uncharacterized protein YaaN involved in tellurite resistance